MSGDGPGRREVAHRLFAAEFDDADLSYSESDEERAPNYVVTPTGARVNRLFAVGVLTEVESVNEDVLRARVADPTGAFVTYAGQYQPDAAAYFDRTEPPAFVALTGKARTFEPEDSDRVFTSVRPESANTVDADTRDRWVVTASEATLDRVDAVETALETGRRGAELEDALREAGVRESLATGVPLALEHYGTTRTYLDAVRRLATDALEVVAGERDAVRSLDVAPDEGGEAASGAPSGVDASAATDESEPSSEDSAEAPDASAATADGAEQAVEGETGADAGQAVQTASSSDEAPSAGAASADESATPDPASESAPESESEDAETGSADAEPASTEDADADADAGPADPESGESAAGEADADDEPLGDFESGTDEMYELDDEERREVEDEFGTDFSTGNQVDAPGEADIDVPTTEESEAESAGDAADASDAGEAGGAEEADAEPAEVESVDGDDPEAAEASSDEADAEDVDLETAAVEYMNELDDGDGADHEAVVAAVVDEYGADPGAVEDAIQSALMSGRCYEPNEETLKAI